MTEEIECPWCGEKTIPKSAILQCEAGKVTERSCLKCGKVIAAYSSDESFLDFIRERVITFKD